MRKFLAFLGLGIAVLALAGLVATTLGVRVGSVTEPIFFARALVASVALFALAWRRSGPRPPTK